VLLTRYRCMVFQCSSASRKFLNRIDAARWNELADVSVLFSEPKIPQFDERQRRFANIGVFQCSSASRKFLNFKKKGRCRDSFSGFSALQRAENSSIVYSFVGMLISVGSFSALQRAENSSIFSRRYVEYWS